MEKRGIPSVEIASTAFERLANLEASFRGLSKLPMVVMPHPIGGVYKEKVAKMADDYFEAVLNSLLTGRGLEKAEKKPVLEAKAL